ncbi:hypothetical protein JTE90_013656 [Oedothorax gibbosus]|uniref:RRM domain-containing protein n=1 Tax=Oedothorax gibbosus TaxID=931172 RepID=A0AAV6VD70_9ARAC|nr:hypothetical protein JTE90_013656 [Oedothorax gibbosus]
MASGVENKSLYVGNLSPNCTEASLFEKFSPIGTIMSLKICREPTGRSLGYGYVNFTESEDAETALRLLNHQQVAGRALRIMWTQKDLRSKLLRDANLVVKNLPKCINDKLLMEIFSRYGSILSVKVATYPNGMSKGYGFVQFESEYSAQNAISSIDDPQMVVDGKKIVVAKFIPAEERQKFHQTTYSNNVFVKNLEPSVTNEEFEKLCACLGDITSAKIVANDHNESKGYGFVSFKSSECAIRAVEQLNRLCLNGRMLFASIAKTKSPSVKAQSHLSS